MGNPYSYSNNHHIKPRFQSGQQGPYHDPAGMQDYRGPAPVPPQAGGMDSTGDPERFRQGLEGIYGKPLPAHVEESIGLIMKHGAHLPNSYLAYTLATADHETGGFAKDEEDGRGKGQDYGLPADNGRIYYGRGPTMLTHKHNYADFDELYGMNGALVDNPDLAKGRELGARILVDGLNRAQGFTGHGAPFYLGDSDVADEQQFRNARRAVNGTDRAEKIAKRAMAIQDVLVAAGRRPTPKE